MTSRIFPKYLRSDIKDSSLCCALGFALRPSTRHNKRGRTGKFSGCRTASTASKRQRHHDAEGLENPLRRGVSAAKCRCGRWRCSKTASKSVTFCLWMGGHCAVLFMPRKQIFSRKRKKFLPNRAGRQGFADSASSPSTSGAYCSFSFAASVRSARASSVFPINAAKFPKFHFRTDAFAESSSDVTSDWANA